MSKTTKPNERKARDFTKNREEHPIVADWTEDGFRLIVMSMGGRNFTAYIGVPLDHPLAGYDYDLVPVWCHGGLTFAGAGDGKYRPKGYYWYGWDYAHAGDFMWFGDEVDFPHFEDDRDWTLDEVKEDTRVTVYELKKLRGLVEIIAAKAKLQALETV